MYTVTMPYVTVQSHYPKMHMDTHTPDRLHYTAAKVVGDVHKYTAVNRSEGKHRSEHKSTANITLRCERSAHVWRLTDIGFVDNFLAFWT